MSYKKTTWNKVVSLSQSKFLTPILSLSLLVLSVYLLLSGDRILFYPVATTFISISAITISIWKKTNNKIILLEVIDPRILDIGILAILTLTTIVSRIQPVGLPDSYYWLVVLVTILIAIRVYHNPSTVTIIQITLLGLVTRSTLWFSAPVIDRDPNTHLGVVKYVMETGNLIPESILYYHWYPIAHIISASTSLLTGLEPKVSIFWATVVPLVVSLPLIYSITIDITGKSERTGRIVGLFAILLIVINGRNMTGNPHPQTLAWALLIPIVFLVLQEKHYNNKILMIILFTSIILTHNLTPLFLISLVALVCLVGKTANVLDRDDSLGSKTDYKHLLYLLGIGTLYHYITASYLSLQVNRALEIFIYRGNIERDVTTSIVAANATIGIQDPLFHQALDLLLYLFALIGISLLKYHAWKSSNNDGFSMIWYSSLFILVGIIGVSIFAGGSQNTARLLGGLSILMAPVLAYAVGKLAMTRPGVFLSLLVLTAFPLTTAIAAENGLRNPGTSLTERTGDVRVHLTDREVAGVEFIFERSIHAYSDGYPSAISQVESFDNGWNGPIEGVAPLHEVDQEKIRQNTPFLYREQLNEVTNITYPDNCSKYYDSGGAQLVYC